MVVLVKSFPDCGACGLKERCIGGPRGARRRSVLGRLERHRLQLPGGPLFHSPLTPDVRRIANDAHAFGVRRFYVTGGEPLLHPEFFEIIASLQGLGEVVFFANGTLLEEPGGGWGAIFSLTRRQTYAKF
ncbi:MAG: hypothetical protein RX316_10155 [bacterium]|nr:hypothetical protein [bacterium]